MKKLFLLTIFFSSLSLAQFQGFQSTFTFSEFSIHSQDLVLGYDPFGTDGLDPNLGETIVPQVPPSNFGVRFQLPSDTSMYTLKDIRFGCGQIYSYEHLIDLSYEFGFMDVNWEWSGPFDRILFKNPYNGEILETFEAFWDSSFYFLPFLDKIIIEIIYSVPLSWPSYNLTSPLGGEVIEGGQNFLITWSSSLAQWVDIEFSSNAGVSWSYIAQNLPASQNSFSWNVPNINSEHCLIRIGEYPCAFDNTEGTFVIYENVLPSLNPVEIPFCLINSIGDTINLIAGMHPTATSGLDTLLGEESIQFPPFGNFAAGMVINSNLLSIKNYLPGYSIYIGNKIYYFKVQPNIDSLVTFSMNVPDGVIPTLSIIRKVPNGIGFIDTTFLSNEISYQFPPRTFYGGYSNWPGIRLKLNFDGTIPVELMNYTIRVLNHDVQLNWTTATEINNKGFEILRSTQNDNDWVKIGFVNGHGTTTEPQFYSFADESLQPGKYQYRLKQIDFDGNFEYSKIVEVTIEAPTEFSLSQNYPNPFNPTTKIKYTIPTPHVSSPLVKGRTKEGFVTLKIYDVLGNEVATLVNEEKPAGEYEVEFTVGQDSSPDVSSGIYFYQLTAGDFVQTKKMVLMK